MEKKTDNRTLLIATFIPTNNIDWFFKYLEDKFNIKQENVFVYEILDDKKEFLLTFKIKNVSNVDFKTHFKNSTIVNIKNGCIFSINGLNRLIELESKSEIGNIEYKNHKINWDKYKNTLILSNKNTLVVKNIKKIDKRTLKK